MYHLNEVNISNLSTSLLDYNSENTIEFHHTLNVNHLVIANNETRLKEILNHDDSIVSIDGQWIIFALKFRFKIKNIVKNSGSDLLPLIISKAAKEQTPIMLLGSNELNNKMATEKAILNHNKLKIIGYSPPYHPLNQINKINKIVFDKIINNKIKIIVLAFGVPKQEYWAFDNREKLIEFGVKKVYFFGGSIDFYSGNLKRSPHWIQLIGFESLYRLLINPKRLNSFITWIKFLPQLFINK